MYDLIKVLVINCYTFDEGVLVFNHCDSSGITLASHCFVEILENEIVIGFTNDTVYLE